MARPNLNDDEKLIAAGARLPSATMTRVVAISKEREWSTSQTLRKLIERGLESFTTAPPEASGNDVTRKTATA